MLALLTSVLARQERITRLSDLEHVLVHSPESALAITIAMPTIHDSFDSLRLRESKLS